VFGEKGGVDVRGWTRKGPWLMQLTKKADHFLKGKLVERGWPALRTWGKGEKSLREWWVWDIKVAPATACLLREKGTDTLPPLKKRKEVRETAHVPSNREKTTKQQKEKSLKKEKRQYNEKGDIAGRGFLSCC